MKRILIIKPSSLGDVIQSLPVASALKDRFPEAEVDWLVNRPYVDLLRGNPSLREVIPFDRNLWRIKRRLPRSALEFAGLIARLRGEGYDTVVDLQGLFRSGAIGFLSGARRRVGFRNAREGAPLFYTERVQPVSDAINSVKRYLLLASHLGADVSAPRFFVPIGERERAWAARLLEGAAAGSGLPHVAVNPSARWGTKRWPPERFARLCREMAGSEMAFPVLIGAESDPPVREALRRAGDGVAATGPTSLLELAALLSQCRALVTNDTGPMHLASALGVPAVALFGPTDPARTGPFGDSHKVLKSPVDCSPCYKRRCRRRENCMEAISVEGVLAALGEILSGERGRGAPSRNGSATG